MTQKKTCLEENFHAIAAILRDLNIMCAEASYGGSGDSGDVYHVAVRYHAEDEPHPVNDMPRVKLRGEVSVLKDGQRASGFREYELDFRTAMTDLVDAALKASEHDGYEIDDGGEGTLTIFATGKAVLAHEDFFDDSEQREASEETTEFSAEEDTPVASVLRVIARVLAGANVASVELRYSGAGDSGDSFKLHVMGDESILSTLVTIPTVYRVYDPETRAPSTETRERTMDLRSAIGDLTNRAFEEAGLRGWENNEGGRGSLVIKQEGTALLTHYNNFVGAEESTYEWNEEESQQ